MELIFEDNKDFKKVVQNFGHSVKFAKHLVALGIKYLKGFTTDVKLIEFLSTDPIGKEIGYGDGPCPSIFSKVRERADPQMLEDLINVLLRQRYKNKIINRVVQDSTNVDVYSKKRKSREMGQTHRAKEKAVGEKTT